VPEVIIPFAGKCPHRERALSWVTTRYESLGWPVTVAPGGNPWVKAEAIMPAVEASSADVLVIADADVWTDGLHEAVRAVELGEPWAKPHKMVHRLSEAGTDALFINAEEWRQYPLDQRPYRGVSGGGFTVARRQTFLRVPMDPRYVGWGQEDISHAIALYTMTGVPWLGDADLIHLWHPPQKRLSRAFGSTDSKRLLKRYIAAKSRPDLMTSLLEEIHDHQPPQPTLHPDPSV